MLEARLPAWQGDGAHLQDLKAALGVGAYNADLLIKAPWNMRESKLGAQHRRHHCSAIAGETA